jgi:hypothetical protein
VKDAVAQADDERRQVDDTMLQYVYTRPHSLTSSCMRNILMDCILILRREPSLGTNQDKMFTSAPSSVTKTRSHELISESEERKKIFFPG